MARRVSSVTLVVGLVAAAACVFAGLMIYLDRAPAPPPYDPGSSNNPAAAFKDDAPQNRKSADVSFPTAFVDYRGSKVELANYRDGGKSPRNLVLIVVRGIPQSPGGVPCAYCVAQANSMAANYADFEKRDAEVLVVFPGPSEHVQKFIDDAAKKPELPFPLLLDADMKVCDRLGIRGDLAKPSTYVLDKKGNVVYAYVGETLTDRPSLKAILAQLDKLQPKPPVVPPPATKKS